MTRAKKKAVNPPSVNHSKNELHPFAGYIQRLEELRQPWNTVVRAAINLLRRPKSPDFCEVVSLPYGYAELVQKKGIWQSPNKSPEPNLSNHAKRNAIGIVLEGRVEVIGSHLLPKKPGKCSIPPAQPQHLISMENGEVLGAYEFTGNLFQQPESHEYEVLSGPVCIQFNHQLLNPFDQKTTTNKIEKNLASCAMALKSEQVLSFKEWWTGGKSHCLIKAFADASAIQAPHSELLFIDLKYPYLDDLDDRHAWEAFRNAVVEVAWTQSRASRGRDFKTSSVPPAECPEPKDLKGIEIEAFKATLVHLDEVINRVGTLWSQLQESSKFPAIDSFLKCEALQRLNIEPEVVFLKETLMSLPLKMTGRLSIVDFISRYNRVETVAEVQTQSIKREHLTAWKLDDPLANQSGFTSLQVLKKYIDSFTEKLKTRYPQALLKIESNGPYRSGNPFQRFWIGLDSGLDTLPAVEWVENQIGLKPEFHGVLIIACQHFLRETCAWFAHLMSRGATIVAIGKDYSTCPEVARRLQRMGVTIIDLPTWEWKPGEYVEHLEAKAKLAWEYASRLLTVSSFKEVIIIDDGGVVHKTAKPFIDKKRVPKWCGVEQTTSGEAHANAAPYPVAMVSNHREKKIWESKIIAEKISENSLRMCAPLSGRNKKIGIIGAGAIAKAVAEKFSKDEYSVFWYSKDLQITGDTIHRKQTVEELLSQVDVVFGCAGHDVLGTLLQKAEGQKHVAGKWFISCSSGDTEFASLLKLKVGETALCSPLRPHNPFSTMVVQTTPSPCFVLNGGFPINFDRERDSVPLHLIQFTRALMHVGLMKAREISETAPPDTDNVSWEQLRAKLGGKLIHAGE